MKVVILSDTHGSLKAVEDVFTREPDADLYLHAGDVVPDAQYLATLTDAPVVFVPGNCDWPDPNVPLTQTVEAAGHQIFLAHGHSFGARYTTDLLAGAARDANCDIAVYGHTHVAEISRGEVTVLNPGSAARPRDGKNGSYLVLDLAPKQAPTINLFRLA